MLQTLPVPLPRLSIKTSLILTILVVGLLGLGLALLSSNIYRDVILDYKRQSLTELLEIKIRDNLEQLQEYSRDLGNSLKSSESFQEALANKNIDALKHSLEQQFHQYFVTAHILRLERLVLLTADLKPVQEASAQDTTLSQPGTVCPKLTERAAQRQGPTRLQVMATLCNYHLRPYYAVLLPIGGLVPKGYLEIVTAPTSSLQSIENDLGMPIQLRLPDGQVLYQSQQWPESRQNGLVARYRLKTSDNSQPALLVEIYDDTQQMYSELKQTRNTILISSAMIITLVILIALVLLRHTLIQPLEMLNRKLQRLHRNNKLLGEPIKTRSNIIEINQLMDDFNQMAVEMHTLYGRLERMAYTDTMTRLPNRGLFNDYIDYLLDENNGADRCFALFLIDLDEFKRVNDEHGHEAGDMLLCEAASRMNNVLRTPSLSDNNGISLVDITDHDLLVRLGGDEFAAVIPEFRDKTQLEEIVQKLIHATRPPVTLYNTPLMIHLSIGIAIYPADGHGRTSLLRHADTAMYHAKNHNHDYCFYHQLMIDTRTSRR